MKIIYIADDGKQFDNENECYSYETGLKFSEVINIDFYDKNSNIYHIDKNDMFNDKYYNKSEAINIHNNAELICLRWLANECGWCEFTDYISEPGFWIRKEKEHPKEGIWIKKEGI